MNESYTTQLSQWHCEMACTEPLAAIVFSGVTCSAGGDHWLHLDFFTLKILSIWDVWVTTVKFCYWGFFSIFFSRRHQKNALCSTYVTLFSSFKSKEPWNKNDITNSSCNHYFGGFFSPTRWHNRESLQCGKFVTPVQCRPGRYDNIYRLTSEKCKSTHIFLYRLYRHACKAAPVT